ncbi:MAG: MFS transporter [Clostridia bacterium]|jgi:hypothetical protein|nr:MFS transporter [Clostridia bacterium]HJJ16267.1 MFS transporter [Clostridiaceae bacterium]
MKKNDSTKKLNKSAKCLIMSDLIYTITALFAETFLVAYFLKITNENIVQIALYYIIVKSLMGIGLILMGNFIKGKPNIRTKILSLGIVVRAIFILFIVILGNKLSNYFVIVAIFCGISETLYWSTHELIFIDVTSNENRKDYMSIKKILSTITKIVAPLVLGSTIELYSFTKIAIYIFVLSVIQIIISLQIKPNELNTTKEQNDKYDIKAYIKEIMKNRNSKVNAYYRSNLIYGIIEDPMSTLVTIITVMTFKTSLNLGILTTIFSIFSIISLYLYKKYYNKNNSKIILSICSILIFIGAVGLVIDIGKSTLIIYNFACTVSLCIFDVIFNTQKGNLIKECNIENRNVEHVMLNGLLTDISRVIGFCLILIAGLINNMIAFKILLLIIALCVPVYSKLISNLEKS